MSRIREVAYFLLGPRAVVNFWLEATIPPFPALIPIACLDILGYPFPLRTMPVHGIPKALIFLGCPKPSSKIVGQLVVPTLAAVLVCAAGKVRCDLVPVDGSSLSFRYHLFKRHNHKSVRVIYMAKMRARK